MLSAGPVRALAVAALTALTVALLPALPAQAAERTVSGGRLDWGVKASFQSYVTGPVAEGSWRLEGGAATVGQDLFRFHSARGGYDPDDGGFHASFSGGVHFTGHRGPDGGYALDLTLSSPTVRIPAGSRSGTLHADLRSKDKATGKVTERAQVPLAALDLSGVDMRGAKSPVALTRVPARLTAQGAQGFAGYYREGTPLDPVSLSTDVKDGPAPSGKPDGDKKSEPRQNKGEFTAAALDWGVRRTFREYVSGPVADGAWKLTGGAQDGGALFRFPAGKGEHDPESGALDARFTGAVRFTGHRLDLKLDGFTVRVRDGKGTVSADVTRDGGTPRPGRPLVTFDAPPQKTKPEKGLVRLTEAPARLTPDGARAFGGMYREGTAMDPVSLAVPLDEDAELPALPDLGSDPSAAPRDASASPSAAASGTGSVLVPVAAGGAAVLLAAGAAVAVRARRTRATDTSDATPATAPEADSAQKETRTP
ncbi:HtaA domain-containing protein [Streptomyces sp. HNM0574]|uniref:HtaA domain-containing protein n=1 Tax=Streptomyces sp. HNM0574 TaxID=2714954 RepID=UPI00146C9698|nr:HtaA domain-containing protein [Streptomyces sp. HNM0574]NLU70029.1 Htaa domain protein [Streptomyces sp. HNM0574]